jgi:hypothetical protein
MGGAADCACSTFAPQALQYKGFVTDKNLENASFLLHAKMLHHNVMPI